MKEKEAKLREFVENAVIQGKATYDGDYKVGNKASDRLFKMAAVMKEDRELAQSLLDVLLYHDEPNVRIWASGIAIDIGYKVSEAERNLTELAKRTDLGILRLDAEMSLRVRKDKLEGGRE